MPSDDWMLRQARKQLKNELTTTPRLKKEGVVPNSHFLKEEEKKKKEKKKDAQ